MVRGSGRKTCEPDVLLSDRRTLSQDTLADLDSDVVSAENQKLSRDDNDDSLATSIRLYSFCCSVHGLLCQSCWAGGFSE